MHIKQHICSILHHAVQHVNAGTTIDCLILNFHGRGACPCQSWPFSDGLACSPDAILMALSSAPRLTAPLAPLHWRKRRWQALGAALYCMLLPADGAILEHTMAPLFTPWQKFVVVVKCFEPMHVRARLARCVTVCVCVCSLAFTLPVMVINAFIRDRRLHFEQCIPISCLPRECMSSTCCTVLLAYGSRRGPHRLGSRQALWLL